MSTSLLLSEKRKKRVRFSLKQKSKSRPRLSVFRSNRNIYAQIIDDVKGITIASSSTKDKELAKSLTSAANLEAAVAVGELLAERALKSGVQQVVFDRGAYMYHGRVKALADAARLKGLKF